jgi:hypothetical protein
VTYTSSDPIALTRKTRKLGHGITEFINENFETDISFRENPSDFQMWFMGRALQRDERRNINRINKFHKRSYAGNPP